MSTFRSEMQVPVNKRDTNEKNCNDSNTIFNKPCFTNSYDQWNDESKNRFNTDYETFNSYNRNLTKSNSILDNQVSSILQNNNSVPLISENFFQQLQSQIAKGCDNNMHFTAKFDMKDIIDPDKVQVFVKDTSLLLIAEFKELMNSNCSMSKECCKRFNLPPNIISESISCTISNDNTLTLDGVLDSSFDQRKVIQTNILNSPPCRSQRLLSSSSNSSIHSPSYCEKFKISMPIGTHYNPQDISIKARNDKIFINARHEEKTDFRTNYREFSKEIQIPENVDPLSLNAIFNNGVLSIEAPFTYNLE